MAPKKSDTFIVTHDNTFLLIMATKIVVAVQSKNAYRPTTNLVIIMSGYKEVLTVAVQSNSELRPE